MYQRIHRMVSNQLRVIRLLMSVYIYRKVELLIPDKNILDKNRYLLDTYLHLKMTFYLDEYPAQHLVCRGIHMLELFCRHLPVI